MLHYRTFHNTDPPALVALWRSRAGQPGLTQPVSVEILEQLVFGKVYFDYKGLILAFENDRPVGFTHAGFGPNRARDGLSTEVGVTCVVVVHPECNEVEVADGLVRRAEVYLQGRGARVLYGGGVAPIDPFYLGLYGGGSLPGVLDTDTLAQNLFRSHDYREADRILIYKRDLGDFRAPLDRKQMQMRRRMTVTRDADPPARDWWEACSAADFDYLRFDLVPRDTRKPIASAVFRSMELYGSNLEQTLGLVDVEVDPQYRRQGAATFLLSESFRMMGMQGTKVVDSQTSQTNAAYVGLLRNLGFQQVGRGDVFRKEVPPSSY
jgi:ribosomal protein S18 acetylase RimI-like enzyme